MTTEKATWLADLCAQCGVAINAAQAQKMCALLDLLLEENQQYNLTAIRDFETAAHKHVVDALLPLASGALPAQGLFLDVGTGAGFPGLPLAIALPQARFVLLDSTAKKLGFVQKACNHLGLLNVETCCARAEEAARGELILCHRRAIALEEGAESRTFPRQADASDIPSDDQEAGGLLPGREGAPQPASDKRNALPIHADAPQPIIPPLPWRVTSRRVLRHRFDCVTARAVAALPQLCEYALPFVKKGGKAVFYKGPEAARELAQATLLQTLGGENARVIEARLPSGDPRTLVVVEKRRDTPVGYPRENARIIVRPSRS